MTIEDLVGKIDRVELSVGALHAYEIPGTEYFHAVVVVDAGSGSTDSSSLYPFLLAEMLDEGTTRLNREEFRLALERLGSEIRFELTPTKLFVRVEGMAAAFEATVALLKEMLASPLLGDASFASVSERLKSEYEDEREDTRKLAHAELTTLLFSREHPLRIMSPDEKINLLGAASALGVRSFYGERARGRLDIIVVGDISTVRAQSAFKDDLNVFDKSSTHESVRARESGEGGAHHVYVPGKENVDVFFGWNTDVKVGTDEYSALSVAIELLGGSGFTGHLMQTVREREGLTYGIYARLRDTSSSLPVYAYVWATFGNPLAEKGMEITRKEIRTWQSEHITQMKLEQKIREIRGSYLVQFQDPEVIASRIASTIASGRNIGRIATYLTQIGSLTEDTVKASAEKYLNPDRAALATAGSVRFDRR